MNKRAVGFTLTRVKQSVPMSLLRSYRNKKLCYGGYEYILHPLTVQLLQEVSLICQEHTVCCVGQDIKLMVRYQVVFDDSTVAFKVPIKRREKYSKR